MTRYFDLVPGYEALATVYDSAIEQASEGKGRERHAEAGEPYEKQIICEVARRVGLGYPLGQAVKKVYEAQRLGGERGVAELLGALNYIAAAVIVMNEKAGERSVPKDGDELVVLWKHKPEAEGCEALVEKDAPQTPAELYDKIIASNPATFGRPRTPTGEELAEMAEEEGNA